MLINTTVMGAKESTDGHVFRQKIIIIKKKIASTILQYFIMIYVLFYQCLTDSWGAFNIGKIGIVHIAVQ